MIAPAGLDATGARAGAGAACPRCGTPPGQTTLLTSMNRYYACGSCPARWSVARSSPPLTVSSAP